MPKKRCKPNESAVKATVAVTFSAAAAAGAIAALVLIATGIFAPIGVAMLLMLGITLAIASEWSARVAINESESAQWVVEVESDEEEEQEVEVPAGLVESAGEHTTIAEAANDAVNTATEAEHLQQEQEQEPVERQVSQSTPPLLSELSILNNGRQNAEASAPANSQDDVKLTGTQPGL